MKIALIGPAFPYRGGIAHHTNMLARYLRSHGHHVDIYTFSLQYPKLLYPGQFQEEPSGEEPVGEEGETRRTINSINPFTWMRTGMALRNGGYDLVVFKWWLPFFGFCFATIAALAHRRGRKDILVIVDNLLPHERNPGDLLLAKTFFRYCTMAITQSGTVHREFAELFPSIPQKLLPHPTYEQFGQRLEKEEARRRVGVPVDAKVLLFFGFVRKYKGLDSLLAAMPEIVRRLPDVHLLVVGEFFDDPAPYMEQIRSGGVEPHVTVHNRYVANDEVLEWFSAADMLVLPYHSATNSGIVMIGYNFAVPAIVTDVGSLSEVVIDGRTGFVLAEATPDAIASAVERMYDGETLERFSENIVPERRKYSWEAFVTGLESLVEEVAGTEARRK